MISTAVESPIGPVVPFVPFFVSFVTNQQVFDPARNEGG